MPDDAPRTRARPSLTPPASRSPTTGHPVDTRTPEPPKPPVTQEERDRGRLIGLAALGAAAVVAIVVTVGIFVPALGAMFAGAPTPVDVANLPPTITVCDVEYTLVATTPESLDGARTRASGEPVVVGVRGSCPEGVCVRNGACLDVVFLKTTDDRFVPYSVQDATDTS